MTSRDFVYWLMGFFEISDNEDVSINQKQAIIIRNHINLVFEYEKTPKMNFVPWLQGFFEIANQDVITKEQTQIILKRLKSVFLHEIDPSMGNTQMQSKMNNIHGGTNAEGIMRC
jgi:hypothetical protein